MSISSVGSGPDIKMKMASWFKAHSHSLQRSADSAVDCVNTEIGIFLSLRSNTTVCHRRTRKMQ